MAGPLDSRRSVLQPPPLDPFQGERLRQKAKEHGTARFTHGKRWLCAAALLAVGLVPFPKAMAAGRAAGRAAAPAAPPAQLLPSPTPTPESPPPPDPLTEAKDHYRRGSAHYQLAEYQQAAAEFRDAFRLRSEPGILFNLAQSMRLAGNPKDATSFGVAQPRPVQG